VFHVHILRPASLPDGLVEDAFSIIEHAKGFHDGPVKFSLHSWDFEPDAWRLQEEELEAEGPLNQIVLHNTLRHSESTAFYSMRPMVQRLRGMVASDPLKIGMRKMSAERILNACDQVASDFRTRMGIGASNSLVLIATTQGNTNNFFSSLTTSQPHTAFVQINHTVLQAGQRHLLLAHYFASLPLRALGFSDLDYNENYAHLETRGCMNDLCADSLDQLRIKTKTADICDDCKGILSDNKVPFPIIEQLRNVFSLVRKIQINIEDFQQDWRQPRLVIKARQLEFPDNGLALRIPPIQMALYVLFMQTADGIHYSDMDQHLSEFTRLYGQCYAGDDPSEAASVARRLCDISDSDALRQTISHCNAKIKGALGRDVAAPFLIQGPRGEKKRISCDRALVEFNHRHLAAHSMGPTQ
jgi:hypothetical protein